MTIPISEDLIKQLGEVVTKILHEQTEYLEAEKKMMEEEYERREKAIKEIK